MGVILERARGSESDRSNLSEFIPHTALKKEKRSRTHLQHRVLAN